MKRLSTLGRRLLFTALFSSLLALVPRTFAQAERAVASMSHRAVVGTGDNALFATFQVEGTATKSILIRAVGPTLAALGIAGALSDPMLQVYSGQGALLASNDDWGGSSAVVQASADVGALGFAAGSKDAALVFSAPPGVYTVRVSGVGEATGVAMVEVYDADSAARLPLASTRGQVTSSGLNPAVGFTLGGGASRAVLIRGLGPGLAAAGMPATLANPGIAVFRGVNNLGANDDWGSAATAPDLVSAAATAGLRPLADGSKDSALLLALEPGAYSVYLSSVDGSTPGVAQVEVAQIDAFRAPFAPALVVPVESATVTAGGSSTFLAVAIGNPAPTYQWRKNGTPIPGATGAALTLAGLSAADAGNYSIALANSAGTTVSADYVLSVFTPTPQAPVFTQMPVSQSVFAGQAVSFSARATGTPSPSYQWRKAGVAISGATRAFLDFSAVREADAGSYDMVATNSEGSAVSAAATLALLTPIAPSIITQPAGAVLNVTNVGTLGVVASGFPEPTYQWRKEGVPIAGANRNVFSLGPVSSASAGSYDVVVTNRGGSVVSDPAVVVVRSAAILISTQPASIQTYVGASAVLSIEATGIPGAPVFQWRKDGIAIGGATAASLTFTSVKLSDAGTYDVVAGNGLVSVTSAAATVTVGDSAPTIVTAPSGMTLAIGGRGTLSVKAVGTAPLSYQWRRGALTLPGATNAMLTLDNAQTFDAGDYTVTVTNPRGSVVSAVARVNVIPQVVAYSARLTLDGAGAVAAFTIEGGARKKLLVRAVGPGLAPFGLSGLSDPLIEIFNSAGNLVALNDNWSTPMDRAEVVATTAAVGAFALAEDSKDAALVVSLPVGTYTVRARPATGGGGIAFLELHDADLAASGPTAAIPFVAVRGRLAPGGGGLIVGGLGASGRGPRSYLLRAVGPSLGLADSVLDPALLVVRGNSLVGQNDNWDAVATDAASVSEASARVGAFPLLPSGRDAAIVLTGNLHAGSSTTQVSGADSFGGVVLLELHDLDAARPAAFAPTIVSPPVDAWVATGGNTTLRVRANGTAPLTYQWRSNGIPIVGATNESLTVANATAAVGGWYSVVVTNSLGSVTSLAAQVTVDSSFGAAGPTQSLVGEGYAPGSTVTVSIRFPFSPGAAALGWLSDIPTGWSFVSDSATGAIARPRAGQTGAMEWAWSDVSAGGAVEFSFTLAVPPGSTGDRVIFSRAYTRADGGALTSTVVTPSPLLIRQTTVHSADLNGDNRLDLAELLRVIQLYNSRANGVRTGAYAVATGTSEDGFAPDFVRTGAAALARYHSADTSRDGRLSLVELTRVIELYNVRAGTVRTGHYKLQPGSEDGFGLGP